MSISSKRITLNEFDRIDDAESFELIEGELQELAATKLWQVIVAGRFVNAFVRYSDTVLPGEVLVGEGGFAFENSYQSLLVPDVAFLRNERVPSKAQWDDWIRIPPDAAVEVKSPSNSRREIERKVSNYLAGGVALVLFADTDTETITAYYADGRVSDYHVGDIIDGGSVLPGFSVPVTEIFA